MQTIRKADVEGPSSRLLTSTTGDAGSSAIESQPHTVSSPEATVSAPQPVPSPIETYSLQLEAIKRQVVVRRRVRTIRAIAECLAFIVLPTLLAFLYLSKIATPLFESKSEIVVIQSGSASGGTSGLGMQAGSPASSRDAISIQSYMLSLEALSRLNEDGYFEQEYRGYASLQTRLGPEPNLEELFRAYQEVIRATYDPSEGMIRLSVLGPSPRTSEELSERLISLAEERAEKLSSRMRESIQLTASQRLEESILERNRAFEKLLALQAEYELIDISSEARMLANDIASLRESRREKEVELRQVTARFGEESGRVQVIQDEIDILDGMISEVRSSISEGDSLDDSISSEVIEIRMAEADLEIRDQLLMDAMNVMEIARQEAVQKAIFLETVVRPVSLDVASHPQIARSVVLVALLLFGGYLIARISLSVLREQLLS